MDRETGPDTRPIGPVVPGREPAIREPNRPEPAGRAPERTVPGRTIPADAGPARAESGRAGPDYRAPTSARPGRGELKRPELPDPITPGFSTDPRVPVWIRRAILAMIAGVAVGLWQSSWRWGLTVAAAVAIIDTIYQAKAMSPIPADVMSVSARRRTRHRLMTLRAGGWVALHERSIPGTTAVIDHLVIGPGGVFAVDSERWDRRLPVRTTAGGKNSSGALYHGPFSQSPRLAHARWEAAQAASLLEAELGGEISVSAAMVIYGPTVPWGVATLRDVDVFSGRRIGKFFRRQKRMARGHRLREHEIEQIYAAAERALPPAS